jgi:hypothetical protein
VLAAITPDHLKTNEDDVVLGQLLKGKEKRNEHLLFAPIATVVDPTRPRCPIAVVSLHALGDGPRTLATLTTPIDSQPAIGSGPAKVLYLPNGEVHQVGSR